MTVVKKLRRLTLAWAEVRDIWHQALGFVQSVSSGFGGRKVEKDVFERRVRSCFICPLLAKSESGGTYCSACKCGDNPLSRISETIKRPEYDGPPSKLHFPLLRCPIGQPGFSNETDQLSTPQA